MALLALAMPLLLTLQNASALPGGCTAAAADNVGKSGCYLSGEIAVASAPAVLFWHIDQFATLAAAEAEAKRHRWALAVEAHGRFWLYVIGTDGEKVRGGKPKAVIGPLRAPEGQPVTVRFLMAKFPPGMKTGVHSHSGPEAFYVVDGEQCMETPTTREKLPAGRSYIVEAGPHLQAAPKGRTNLVAIVQPKGAPWLKIEHGWTPTGFCED